MYRVARIAQQRGHPPTYVADFGRREQALAWCIDNLGDCGKACISDMEKINGFSMILSRSEALAELEQWSNYAFQHAEVG